MSDHHHYDEDEVVRSDAGAGETLQEVMQQRFTRRSVLQAGLSGAALLALGPWSLASASTQRTAGPLAFRSIEPRSSGDYTEVPPGYDCRPLLRWGDPVLPGAPPFEFDKQTPASQRLQFGYNCDYVGFLSLPYGSNRSDRGLLVVNHEYTNPELMFAGYDKRNPTLDQVEIEWAAHGLSIAEVRRGGDGHWQVETAARENRRIDATTPMLLTGPAAGSDWMKTPADETGTKVLGTLNNCAAGRPPWGTVLLGEENFHQYFANLEKCEGPSAAVHERYGVPKKASERKWERFDDRFDTAKEPNEPNRFGWVVEIDPYDPDSIPCKRTALGRFRHEAATTVVTPGGRVAVYSGDDARFEYVYKFVSEGRYDAKDRKKNWGLLDAGTLFVAKFEADGTGKWLPLVYGEGPLTEVNGFTSQADVLVNTRRAADLLGATKMDRPEDIEASPATGKVYVVCTKNDDRGKEGRPEADKANPRPVNKAGHILEVEEAGGDHAAATFKWEVFMLCGNPKDPGTYFAGFPRDRVSPIANPDNIAFDTQGNLWIATDGMPDVLGHFDSLYAVPTTGPERGHLKMFFSAVPGAEVCGPEFTPDDTSLFLAIQHPAEESTLEDPSSRWPDGKIPRPSVVVVTRRGGGRIGS
jgi:uncharacterized protein